MVYDDIRPAGMVVRWGEKSAAYIIIMTSNGREKIREKDRKKSRLQSCTRVYACARRVCGSYFLFFSITSE